MTEVANDIAWLADVLEESHLLFYGELYDYLDTFLTRVFSHELSDYGFGKVPMTHDFATAYWLFVSWAVEADLIEYGSSPRGAWLTEKGKRFKRIIQGYAHPIQQACAVNEQRDQS